MFNASTSSLAGSLADTFASRSGILPDVLAWLNDSPDAFLEDYVPGWQDDAYEPSPEAWAEYAAWSRSLDKGCGLTELTPDEEDLYTHSLSDREYRDFLADMEARSAEYDAARDAEECFDRDCPQCYADLP